MSEFFQFSEFHVDNLLWALGTILFIIVSSVVLGTIARIAAGVLKASPGEQKNVFWGFFFAGPWIVGFLIFVLGPALASLLYSFTNYELGDRLVFFNIESGKGNFNNFFIELDNYRALLVDTESGKGRLFKQALFNSFYYTIIGVPLQILAALGMAMLLNRRLPGISVFRTIYYLPVILAASPAALLAWRYMFTSNGGFINNTLRQFADSFFVFDWMYRHFIYLAEGFNSFYQSISRGEAVGSLKYTLPAVIALLILVPLVGEWTPNKRQRVYQLAEVLTIVLVGNLMSTGIFRANVDPSWTYFAALLTIGMIVVNQLQNKRLTMRVWQIGAVVLFAVGLIRTLDGSGFAVENRDTAQYLLPLALGLAIVAGTLVGPWTMRKRQLMMSAMAFLAIIIVVRTMPTEFGDDRWKTATTYLTFGSTVSTQAETHQATLTAAMDTLDPDLSARQQRGLISDTVNPLYDYWKDSYPQTLFSTYWLYGLLVAVLIGIWLLDERYPRARQTMLYGSAAFFAVVALSTYLDGRRYFNTFENLETIVTVEGITTPRDTAHYHFVTFRGRTDTLPSDDRVPQWLQNELWTKPSLVLITMWSSGASMLIFLAALKGVPPVLYEAAEVDGANQVQKFFKITLPMISPAMFYNIVIGVIAALQTFEAIYIIRDPSGANDASLRSAAYFLFTRTFNDLAIGQGAAASWILAAIILTLTILQFRYSKWVNYEV